MLWVDCNYAKKNPPKTKKPTFILKAVVFAREFACVCRGVLRRKSRSVAWNGDVRASLCQACSLRCCGLLAVPQAVLGTAAEGVTRAICVLKPEVLMPSPECERKMYSLLWLKIVGFYQQVRNVRRATSFRKFILEMIGCLNSFGVPYAFSMKYKITFQEVWYIVWI